MPSSRPRRPRRARAPRLRCRTPPRRRARPARRRPHRARDAQHLHAAAPGAAVAGEAQRQQQRHEDRAEQRPVGGVQRVADEGEEHAADQQRDREAGGGRRRRDRTGEVPAAAAAYSASAAVAGLSAKPTPAPVSTRPTSSTAERRGERERERADGHQREAEHDRRAPADPVADAAEEPEHDEQRQRVDAEHDGGERGRHVPDAAVHGVDDGGGAARPERERRGECRGRERGAAGRVRIGVSIQLGWFGQRSTWIRIPNPGVCMRSCP